MRFFVKVKADAKNNLVKKVDGAHFAVSVKERPVDGKANKAVIEILAEYFGVRKSNIKIVSGFTSKQKVIEITA